MKFKRFSSSAIIWRLRVTLLGIALTLVAGTCLTPPAAAHDSDDQPYPYYGLGAGTAKLEGNSGHFEDLFLGFRLRDFASAEITGTDYGALGDIKLPRNAIAEPVTGRAASGALFVNTPSFARTSLFVDYGTDFSWLRAHPHGHSWYWTRTYGAGARWTITQNVSVRLEWKRVGDFARLHESLNQQGVSLVWGF